MARPPVVPAALTTGPFTLDDARRLGLSRRQLQGKAWRRLGAGTYAWAGLPDGPWLRLAAIQLRLPPQAAFAGRTAAWIHALDGTLFDGTVAVTGNYLKMKIPPGRGRNEWVHLKITAPGLGQIC